MARTVLRTVSHRAVTDFLLILCPGTIFIHEDRGFPIKSIEIYLESEGS